MRSPRGNCTFHGELSLPLGSTNPCPSAGHMESSPTLYLMQVASMQKELEELQPKLKVAKEENAKMMTVIEKESTEVEARSKVVKKDEAVANEQAAEAQALKDEVRMW